MADEALPPASRLISRPDAPPPSASEPVPRTKWDPLLVFDRLIEAMRVLNHLPLATRPRGYANSMPRHVYDQSDLQAQREVFDLQLHARNTAIEKLDRDRNRVRVAPTASEIERADEAIAWPMLYLKDAPEVARAVCLGALWAMAGTDVRAGCRKLKMAPRTFYRRKAHGLHVIAIALVRARIVPR